MSDSTRIVTRLIDLDDVQQDSFADGSIVTYQASTEQFIGTVLAPAKEPDTAPVLEDLIGARNGANTKFHLSSTPSTSWPVFILLNGVIQRPGSDFTLSEKTVIVQHAPSKDDWLSAIYKHG